MDNLVKISANNFPAYQDRILEIENLSFLSPWSLRLFKEELKKSISHLWGLVGEDILLGYICFWMFASEIQLINIAVHPEKRGRRLGYKLLNNMIFTGIDKGVHHIWLEVRPSNAVAKKLYDKFGFQEVGRRPNYYTDTKEDAIIMDLVLSNGKGVPVNFVGERQLPFSNI
ncbi:MAG: ribosomal protein S18-alanine N-acetyltransferase [Deltaproteobacteria bacterium]|nr:ribosomal protein S18-alanine N-acetyltransferase [Deltaproteobacteria bacterium]